MRKIAAFMLALLVAVLGGCSNEYDETQEEEKEIVLTVLAGQSTSDAGIEDMIDEWLEKEYPGVRFEWECVDWGDSFDSRIRGRLAAGDMPDIIIGKAQDVKSYAETGQLGVISEKCSGQIKENALEAVTLNGKIYGMPYNFWYQGVIFNKNIFRKLELAPPDTLDELDIIIEKLKNAEIVPFASHFQESWNVANMTMQYMMNDIFKGEPEWGDLFRKGTVNCVGNEQMKVCMENNKKILDASWKDARQIDQFESDSRFTQGEAAMYLTGSWSMQFASQYGKEIQFGIFPFPNQSGDAALIRETNLTFMKSAHTRYDALIDKLLYGIQNDEKLVQEILDFTQSDSAVKGIDQDSSIPMQEDIDAYVREGRFVDVAQGNSQLVWNFQNDAAKEQLSWLKKEKSLEEVLNYMDENRESSIYGE